MKKMNFIEKAIIKKVIKVAREKNEVKKLVWEMENETKGIIAMLIKEELIKPNEII